MRIIYVQGQGSTCICSCLSRTRREFREHVNVNKKDFTTIEHMLRVGRRKLETYSQPGVKNISVGDN